MLFENVFQNIDSASKKSSTPAPGASKGSSAVDPLSMIQAKADTFDGLDPLSMFAAQEATTNKTTAATSVPVLKKDRVGMNDLQMKSYSTCLVDSNQKEFVN